MRLSRRIVLLPAVGLSVSTALFAQVDKVALHAAGLSCSLCAGLSEYNFRRIPGIDKVNISLSKEAILVVYKPGAVLNTEAIREVLKPWKVTIVQFQVSAHGRVLDRDKKILLLAGKETFALIRTANAPAIPAGLKVEVQGILDETKKPKELGVLAWRPASP